MYSHILANNGGLRIRPTTHDGVVDETGVSDFDGEGEHSGAVDAAHRLHRIGIHRFDIIDIGAFHQFEEAADFGEDFGSVPLAFVEHMFGDVEGFTEAEGVATLIP